MACYNCGGGYIPETPTFHYNWFPTSNYPCNPCTTQEVCAKTIPSQCVGYDGANLSNLNLSAPVSLKVIVQKIDTEIGALKQQNALDAVTKANIQAALNDINNRLNTIEGGTPHAPYVI